MTEIIESEQYRESAERLLSQAERQGIRLVLAEDPLCGETAEINEHLLRLRWSRYDVYYTVSPDAGKISLITIVDAEDAFGETEEDRKKINKVVDTLKTAGLAATIREVAAFLWDLFITVLGG